MTTEARRRTDLEGREVIALDARDRVRGSMLRLAERFRPEEAQGVDGSWVIQLDHTVTYTIHIRAGRCLISPGDTDQSVARLVTDQQTWLDLVSGHQDGIAAFMAGKVQIRGDLNLALRLETMFGPGPDAQRVLTTRQTDVKGYSIESLVTGSGTPVLLLHGLAANKVSFVPTFDDLAADYEVHAIDLPGFGKSEKPVPRGKRYTAEWMADIVRGYMIRNGLRDAYVVGNSMGGRIATELALRHPQQVRGMVGLGSAVAFDEWQRIGPALKMLRWQWLGMSKVPLRRDWIETALAELFHDPARIPTDNMRAAAEDVVVSAQDRGYRMAVAACARHLIAERGEGRRGYWTRLQDLQVPSLWIWGRRDRLVSHRYAHRVKELLPHAQVEVWDDVGHVPQFEVPERTNDQLRRFFGRIEAGY